MSEGDEDHVDASTAHCFVAYSRFKDLGDDRRVSKSYEAARAIPRCAEGIDRECDALIESETWNLIEIEPDMKPLPLLCRFFHN